MNRQRGRAGFDEQDDDDDEAPLEPVPPRFLHLVAPPLPSLAGVPMDYGDAARARIASANLAEEISRQRNSVEMEARGFREAGELLIHHDPNERQRRPIEKFTVHHYFGGQDAPPIGDFSRFVALLGQQVADENRAVRSIYFLGQWSGLPFWDVERLFHDVLPRIRTLREMYLGVDGLPARFIEMLTQSIPATTGTGATWLPSLAIHGTSGPPLLGPVNVDDVFQAAIDDEENRRAEIVQAMVDLLNRDGGVENLTMNFDLSSDQTKLIIQAVHRNTSLRDLHLTVVDVSADTLNGVAAATSLRHLGISGSFSEGVVPSLANQLRTNVTLEVLSLDDRAANDGGRDSQVLLDLVKTYNYTLRRVDGNLGAGHTDPRVREQLQVYVTRNARIRKALERLKRTHEEPHSYDLISSRRDVEQLCRSGHFGPSPDASTLARAVWHRLPYKCRRESMPTHLVPQLLGLVSDLPTVLYRVLKMGYVNEVAYHLAKTHVVNEHGDGQREDEGQQLDNDDLRNSLPRTGNLTRHTGYP